MIINILQSNIWSNKTTIHRHALINPMACSKKKKKKQLVCQPGCLSKLWARPANVRLPTLTTSGSFDTPAVAALASPDCCSGDEAETESRNEERQGEIRSLLKGRAPPCFLIVSCLP